MATVFTVGHSTRSVGELIDILRGPGVEVVFDVRRFPGSRRNPHLSREALATALPADGVSYEWWGEDLGGRRSRRTDSRHPGWRNAAFQGYADHMDGPEFRTALVGLEERARTERIAVMCAEAVWWRCHRRLIADALLLRGHEVVHLLDAERRDAHPPHPNLRSDDDGWPVYDVNVDRPLGS